MKFSLPALFIFAVSSLTFSQQLSQEWTARYNGTANNIDYASGLAVDNQRNVYVTGYGYNTGTGRDYITVKYDANGQIQWVKTYNGEVNGGDYSFAIAVDNLENVYVTGRSDRGGPTFSDITTIKYNTNGVVQWIAFYNGPGNGVDEASSIKVDGSGNVYVAGRSDGGSATGEDMVVVKYNANGNQVWAQRYDGTSHYTDRAYSIDVDTDGNVLVCGTAVNNGSGNDFVVLKYNSAGAEQWVKTYNGTGNGGDIASVVKVDPANNVYATGFADNGSSSYDYFTVKINPDGVTQWTKSYNGQGNLGDFPTAMIVDLSGNVFVTGKSAGTSFLNDSNYATVKYNSQGSQQWVAIYQGSNNSVDVARSIALDDQGNVYVTGASSGAGAMNDYTTVKYKNGGLQEWVLRYNGPSNNDDFSSNVVTDALGNVYVTGRSYATGTNFDILTIKYSIPTGISHSGNEIPLDYRLNQNYPNPFNPSTLISFSIPKETNVKLTVFDMSGREVSELVNSDLTAGNYNINFSGENISSGIYFYRLDAGEFTQTKKMILIK